MYKAPFPYRITNLYFMKSFEHTKFYILLFLTQGSALHIARNCTNCDETFQWCSQPYINSTPAGNLLLSAAVLFTGNTASKTLR